MPEAMSPRFPIRTLLFWGVGLLMAAGLFTFVRDLSPRPSQMGRGLTRDGIVDFPKQHFVLEGIGSSPMGEAGVGF